VTEKTRALPDFVPPMLAKIGREPFVSDEHLFEIKWDGTRAIALVEGGDYRLLNRKRRPAKERYPELKALASLPPGTVLDGEICVLVEGKPAFSGMLQREQARGERRIKELARVLPATTSSSTSSTGRASRSSTGHSSSGGRRCANCSAAAAIRASSSRTASSGTGSRSTARR
jgi:hypothetical protein